MTSAPLLISWKRRARNPDSPAFHLGGVHKMPVVSIADVGRYAGQEITLRGWLYNQRESGKLLFPQFRDGTGLLQGVCSQKESPQAFETLRNITQESGCVVTGKICNDQRAT